MPTILVVDDELSMREFLKILLEKEGITALTASEGHEAVEIIRSHAIDLVISDVRMPGMGGLELLDLIKKEKSPLPFIMITAFASPEDAVQAMKHGAYDYITKPFKVDEITAIVNSALGTSGTSGVMANQQTPSNDIIGDSPEMLKIFDIFFHVSWKF